MGWLWHYTSTGRRMVAARLQEADGRRDRSPGSWKIGDSHLQAIDAKYIGDDSRA
jgi:hypothetical protein